jgi:hypothetical protein
MKALTKAGTDTYLRTRTTMALAAYSLADNFAGGYGGPAWEACTRATLALYDALAALTNFKGSANDVIIAAHAVVNSAHNNGPFLNKFIGGEAFENAAHGCAILAVRSLEELHLHASAHRAAEDGPKWPQRKHKAAKVLTVSDVQWNLRQQGTLLHAQTSLGAVKGSHLSGSIPLAMLPVSEIRAIMLCAAFAEQNCTSLAGSSSRYWQARGVLSLETIRIIFPTI